MMETTLPLESLVGRVVVGIYLKVFPPDGETQLSHIDISLHLKTADESDGFTISISKEDNWSPVVVREGVNNEFPWGQFRCRIESWMTKKCQGELDYEFYCASDAPEFINCIGKPINRMETVSLENSEDEPFGVRLWFDDDWVLIYPNVDGSMVEAPLFNFGRGISEFENSFGKVIFQAR